MDFKPARVISDQPGYLFPDWFRLSILPVNQSCVNGTLPPYVSLLEKRKEEGKIVFGSLVC